jgi:hypothetical protein
MPEEKESPPLPGDATSGPSGTSTSSSPVAFLGRQGLDRPLHNLPLELSSFVGRERCAGDGLKGNEILDLLASLVDKSLVLVTEQHREARYRPLETVRQYSQENSRRPERIL